MEYLSQNSSNLNPLALVFMAVMAFVMLVGRREAAVKALLATAAVIPLGQQIIIAGLHFTILRILILVGAGRVLIRGEVRGLQWQTMDKLFLGWALVGLVCGLIRSPSAEIFGMTYNSIGTYFLLRCVIKDATEAVEHVRWLAVVAIVIAVVMAVELVTHKNPLYVLGGVPEFVVERDGRFRCQGSFRHPILAGTFAATLLPILVGIWQQGGRQRVIALLGIAACGFSTIAAASSGALLTCITAALGLGLWGIRYRMKLVRRGILVFIAVLTVAMKPPPWYIISKLSDLFGGTGWHRSYLIDQAVKHADEWWLVGTSVTAHWAPAGQVLAVDPNNMDITNHYISQGINGGMLELGLFLAMIVCGFKAVGRAFRAEGQDLHKAKLWWAFGVALACHCTAFLSISYFDQIEVFWFWLLAVLAVLASRDAGIIVTERPFATFRGGIANPRESRASTSQFRTDEKSAGDGVVQVERLRKCAEKTEIHSHTCSPLALAWRH